MYILTHMKERLSENAWICEDKRYRTLKRALENASAGDIIIYPENGQRRWAQITQKDIDGAKGSTGDITNDQSEN